MKMKFYEPLLSRCDGRNVLAKINPVIKEPQYHINNLLLNQLNCIGVSFDFFIDWKSCLLNREFWIKLPYSGQLELGEELINILRKQNKFTDLIHFARANNISVSGVIFDDEQPWDDPKSLITIAQWPKDLFNKKGLNIYRISIDDLKNKIKEMSGGSIRIGKKGLIYGTSKLECYLSNTDALWPGDADLLIFEKNNFTPLALIEYKKHTQSSKIKFEDQSFTNYYPHPDKLKYDRLLYLSMQLHKNIIPIFVIYYSTNKDECYLIIEKIGVDEFGCFCVQNRYQHYINLDNIKLSYLELIKFILFGKVYDK